MAARSKEQSGMDDRLILHELERLHKDNQDLRSDFRDGQMEMRSEMKAYVLVAVHQKDMENLHLRDVEQQKALDDLQQRILSAPQRYLYNVSAGVAAFGGIFAILHLFHLI